jgi:hypothetical protein
MGPTFLRRMNRSPLPVCERPISPAGKRCRLRLGTALFVLLLFLAGGICLAGAPEHQVKTAFVFNFAKFTEWPSNAFSSPDSPIVILVVGQDPMAEELETLKGKTAQGRKVTVKRSASVPEGERFHVLFICKNESAQLARPLRNRSILTVSDSRQFAHNGGIIGLVAADNRVSFEINTDALDRAGLRLNSQVLKIAKVVRDTGQREDK